MRRDAHVGDAVLIARDRLAVDVAEAAAARLGGAGGRAGSGAFARPRAGGAGLAREGADGIVSVVVGTHEDADVLAGVPAGEQLADGGARAGLAGVDAAVRWHVAVVRRGRRSLRHRLDDPGARGRKDVEPGAALGPGHA